MTLERDNIVKLSAGNWIAIVGIAVTVLAIIIPAYINHDRLLMQVVTQQAALNQRLDKIEIKLEAAAAHSPAR
jgi:heme exporter protein D